MNYSQNDHSWSYAKINNTNSTMGNYGCFITALANLRGIKPDNALRMLETGNGLYRDLVISHKAAQILGLEFIDTPQGLGKVFTPPDYDCICEVDFNPQTARKDQHFGVYKAKTKTFIDSWDGKEKPIDSQKVISYRQFKMKSNELIEDLEKSIKFLEVFKEKEKDRIEKGKYQFCIRTINFAIKEL